MLVRVLAGVKVLGRQFVSVRRVQLELLTVGGCEVIRLRVEVQRAGDGHGSDYLRERRRSVHINSPRV